MKQIVGLLCLAGMFFFTAGCKKNFDGSYSVEGEWELRRVSGMLTVDYPPGNGKKLKFTGNHYEVSDNGQVVQSGTFTIVSDPTVEASTCLVFGDGEFDRRIIYDNNTSGTKIFINVSVTKLSIISGCFALDAGSKSEYVSL